MSKQCPHEWIGPKECIHCGWWPDPADQSRRIIAELAKEISRLRAMILQTPGSRCTSCLNPLDHHAVCPCQEAL
jgi:hypothetical protein